jgi:molybdate transport system ATP-binding protein
MGSRAGSADGSAEVSAGLLVRLHQDAPIPLAATFTCTPGELLALVGPSGSGKSTILRAIAGLYRPESGRVAVDGETWFDGAGGVWLAPHRRRAGLVFQSYALFPHLSALGNVATALGHLPRGQRRARAGQLLELVHLAGLEARRPAELSGGQQQRVAVARALAREPEVLLLDEPFSAVDKATRQRLYRELAELRRQLRMPMVLVTHDLDEALMLADRMTVLHRGHTLQSGPPLEIMARPDSPEVARLVDLKNVFDGVVAEHRPDLGITIVAWAGYRLEARLQPAHVPGQPIAWAIPTANVILHRRDRPSRGERENPVPGVVCEFVPLGENASVAVRLDGAPELPLFMTIPTHVARRNRIGIGERVTVSLLAEAIHLMPRQARPSIRNRAYRGEAGEQGDL